MYKTPCHCYLKKERPIDHIMHYDQLAGCIEDVKDAPKEYWVSLKRALTTVLTNVKSGKLPRYGICSVVQRLMGCYVDEYLEYLFLKVAPFHDSTYPIGGKREYNDLGLSRWEGLQLEARIEMLYALITQVEIEINACDLVK